MAAQSYPQLPNWEKMQANLDKRANASSSLIPRTWDFVSRKFKQVLGIKKPVPKVDLLPIDLNHTRQTNAPSQKAHLN